jgi:CheY-like chemotaxis protein
MDTRKKILVVDDDPLILIVWHDALRKHAELWYVETAQDGYEALEKIKATAFDLIVTDLRMPGMSGCELTVAIRQLAGDVPVIWITGFREPGAQNRAADLAIHKFLNKPLTVAQIRQTVADVLGHTELVLT